MINNIFSWINNNWKSIAIVLAAIVVFIIVLIVFIKAIIKAIENKRDRDEIKQAGNRGEAEATQIIQRCLYKNDHMLTNVEIEFEGKKTELDNVIVNQYGIFIIEVKNYVGKLIGSEDDHEWLKQKITPAGVVYEKNARNPLKQLKRQEYILANYLKTYGIKVWVRGYAYFVNNNSPVHNEKVLESIKEIVGALHNSDNAGLTYAEINKILKLLS